MVAFIAKVYLTGKDVMARGQCIVGPHLNGIEQYVPGKRRIPDCERNNSPDMFEPWGVLPLNVNSGKT